jgi:integrase
MKLTSAAIKAAKPKDKPYKMADGRGLHIIVATTGAKLWRFKYRFDGRERSMALGDFRDVSLADARTRHEDARRLLVSGVDPMAQRKQEQWSRKLAADNTFACAAKLWFDSWKVARSSNHVESTWRRLSADVFPVIGSRPISKIEAPELVRMMKRIEQRGAIDIAKRALQTSGQVFRYAIAHGLATRNPATDIKPSDVLASRTAQNYARISAKELPDLLRKIEVYSGSPTTRLAIKLMALTFVRTKELIGAKWGEFDLEGKRWDIPASRMKMKDPHIVPLSNQAVELLHALRTHTGVFEYLFPGERGGCMSNNTILKAIERMGFKHRMTGHGFRGLASTVLHEQGWPHEHIELQLAHTKRNSVSAAYNHATYLVPRAAMMQAWGDYLTNCTKEQP